jgi:hypothetical protein
MKFFTLLISLFILKPVLATNYYFSDISGKDSYTSTQAQNAATPWKTITKLNSFGGLKPGDSVLFKKGETFYGTIGMFTSGSINLPIVYGSYGSGANPIISGFTTVNNWSPAGGNIFYATVPAAFLQGVTVDGTVKGLGRYPNSGYLTYTSHIDNSAISGASVGTLPANFVGGEVVIKKYRYILDRHKIVGQSTNTIAFNTSSSWGNNGNNPPTDGNGYFIQGHLATLDQDGEWYFNNATQRLYVYFGSGTPNGRTVNASTINSLAVINALSNITFNSLDFQGGNTGIDNIGSTNVTIINCNFRQQANGINGTYCSNFQIIGGSVTDCASNGIAIGDHVTNVLVDGLIANRCGTIAGLGMSGDCQYNGILVNGDGTKVTNCIVKNIGFNGIYFDGNDVLVEHNYVDSFCLVKDDGGGIYTFTMPGITRTNRIIRNNVVLHAIGNPDGAQWNGDATGEAAAIYLDGNSNHTEVSGNSCAYGPWAGILENANYSNQILNNTTFDFNNGLAITATANNGAFGTVRNLLINGNRFVAKTADQSTIHISLFVNDNPRLMGNIDNNIYARPISNTELLQVHQWYSGGAGLMSMSLPTWQSNYSLDLNSQKSRVTIPSDPDGNIRFEHNATNTIKNIVLADGYVDVNNVAYSGSISLQPYTSLVLIKTQKISKAPQTITFSTVPTQNFGVAPFSLNATASSGLPVEFRILSGPATVSGNTVTVTGTGTVSLEASQSGDAKFNAATPVTQTFLVNAPKDVVPPTIIPKNITVQTDANGKATIQPTDVIQSITDNSGVDNSSIQVSQTQFTCSTVPTATNSNPSHQAYATSATTGVQAFGGELGMAFKVNNPAGIRIDALGAFDHQGNGITGTQNGGIRVAIFNKATQSIVPGLDAIVSGQADGYNMGHRFKSVSPVTLLPGEYVVVAKGYNYNELNGNSGMGSPLVFGDLADGAITQIGNSLYGTEGSGFNLPTNPDGAKTYLAGTFSFSVNTNTTTTTTATSHQAYASSATTGVQAFGGELGMAFKVNNAAGIRINALGAFDHQGNGITGTQNGGIRVAIFNKATQSIVPGLEAIVIGQADGYNLGHRFKSVSPVTLLPGEYVVVAKGYNENELNGNSGMGSPLVFGDLADGAISLVGNGLYGTEGSGFTLPTNPDGAKSYLAGTFSFSVNSNITATSNNTNTVIITAKDIYGNIAQATAIVTVVCNQGQTQRLANTTAVTGLTEVLQLTKDASINIKSSALSIFPNPTNGRFAVQLSNLKTPQVTVEVFSENGMLVSKKSAGTLGITSLKMDFDLTNQRSGVYFVKVVGADGVKSGKVVVQH